jgi:cytochrome oxidase Cu insertion factor (SCO1/SenC/PrrC family)
MMMKWLALLLAALSLGPTPALAQSRSYRKPQIGSAAGQLAPDFTLKDQDGNDFGLSGQRGHWVLLFFYRGYW